MDVRGSISDRDNTFPFSTVGPYSLQSNRFASSSPGVSGRGVKLTTNLRLVPRSRVTELCLHGTEVNQLRTGTTLLLLYSDYNWNVTLSRTEGMFSAGRPVCSCWHTSLHTHNSIFCSPFRPGIRHRCHVGSYFQINTVIQDIRLSIVRPTRG
jgi:hypothetical protein